MQVNTSSAVMTLIHIKHDLAMQQCKLKLGITYKEWQIFCTKNKLKKFCSPILELSQKTESTLRIPWLIHGMRTNTNMHLVTKNYKCREMKMKMKMISSNGILWNYTSHKEGKEYKSTSHKHEGS